jgi:hypothetical protein
MKKGGREEGRKEGRKERRKEVFEVKSKIIFIL